MQGAAVHGRYRLDESIGSGAFGEVWRARDTQLDRDVALKFMRAELAENPSLRGRFERESRALARLRHPNVVQVYDTGVWEERPYIVLEFVGGHTLRAVIEAANAAGEHLPIESVRALFGQVCAGIAAAHRATIIHRDIKPENVLIEEDHERVATAKVADFGLARMDQGHSSIVAAVGTFAYMSPEQASDTDAELSPASDVFALGVLLVEMLTGHALPEPPKKTPWERCVLLGRGEELLRASAALRPDAPPAVWEIISRALSRDPTARPSNAQELIRELDARWAGGPSPAPPVLPAPAARTSTEAPLPSVVSLPSMVGGSATLAKTTPQVPTDAIGARIEPAVPPTGESVPKVAKASIGAMGRWIGAMALPALGFVAWLGWRTSRSPALVGTALSAAPSVIASPPSSAPANVATPMPTPATTPPAQPGLAQQSATVIRERVVPAARRGAADVGRWIATQRRPPSPSRPASPPDSGTPSHGMEEARACMSHGGSQSEINRCIVGALRSTASSEEELRLLCVTYRQLGDRNNAVSCMRRYNSRYRSTRYNDVFEEYITGE